MRSNKAPKKTYMCSKSYCTACGSRPPVALHHLKTRGSGGSDEPHNLMPLCVLSCHPRVHTEGLTSMASKYQRVEAWLLRNGWEQVGSKWRHEKENGQSGAL